MKKLSNLYMGLLLGASVFTVSCNKDKFVEQNISPNTLYEVNPEDQFLRGSISIQNDFEYFYDVYRKLNYWLQYTTPATGNGANFNLPGSQFNYRYGNFYGNIGVALKDCLAIIDKLPEEEKASYAQIKAITEILHAYYGFYVSDINGSIPFSEAFQARYGGTLTPKYDTQEEVFDIADNMIKNAVASLKSNTSNQKALGANDPFFGGDVTKWIKTGNALRLKIGLRLMKRNVAKLTSIANEVLGAEQMASIDDSWIFKAGPSFANATGNWNPTGFLAGKPVVDFMKSKVDPRLRIFYRPNTAGEFVGSWPSPDDSKLPANAPLYSTAGSFSELQHRLFTPNHSYDGSVGTGVAFFPLLSYAEYCFMRADLAARGIAGSDAEAWYEKGVMASIDQYNRMAVQSRVPNFVEVTAAEKTAYYNAVGVKYDATKATELIAVQAYLDLYRNPMEAWAWWKRTGFPNTNSVLAWSDLKSNGSSLPLPRRASLSPLPTTNLLFENQQAAFSQMASDPEFGSGPGDPFGRVWWDKQ